MAPTPNLLSCYTWNFLSEKWYPHTDRPQWGETQHDIPGKQSESALPRPCKKGNYFHSNCPEKPSGKDPSTLTSWLSGSAMPAGRNAHMKVRRMSYGTKATEFGVRGKTRHSHLVLLSHLILTPRPPYPLKEEQPNRYSYKCFCTSNYSGCYYL